MIQTMQQLFVPDEILKKSSRGFGDDVSPVDLLLLFCENNILMHLSMNFVVVYACPVWSTGDDKSNHITSRRANKASRGSMMLSEIPQ